MAPRPAPGYWMHETSGALRPAVEAYLRRKEMSLLHIAALRAYLRQWINRGEWKGPAVEGLRRAVDSIRSRDDIQAWLETALEAGIDPL